MSFYDDLKKQSEKDSKASSSIVIPTGLYFNSEERRDVVKSMVNAIKLNCTSEKNKGKRSYKAYCHWWNDTGDWERIGNGPQGAVGYSPFSNLSINAYPGDFMCKKYSNAERDEILRLLRNELLKEGFPSECVQPYQNDYTFSEGKFPFSKKRTATLYGIKVHVKW